MKGTLKGIKSIEDFNLKDKRVFLRLDLNVPIKDGVVQDMTRIDASLPTIRYALDHGAKLVVASHLGRPEAGQFDKFSLEPVARVLGEKLEAEVILVESPESEAPKALLRSLKPNQFILLENLRFHKDETENGSDLVNAILEYTDIYINDAFGASHRAHASVVGIPERLNQKGAGFLMKKEIEMLDTVLHHPTSPFVLLLGGAKVSDKIPVIEKLIDRTDKLIVGGAMAYTFLAALDVTLGNSLVERAKIKYTKELIDRIRSRGKKLILPVDHRVVRDIKKIETLKITEDVKIDDGWLGVDVGPKTEGLFVQELAGAKTVFWNGPMGVFETKEYSSGTFSVARALSRLSSATTIVGGGDSAAAMNASGYASSVSHISTGGGASLEFLQGDRLPGVEALRGPKVESASPHMN